MPLKNVKTTSYEVVSNRPKVNSFRAPCVPQIVFGVEGVISELADNPLNAGKDLNSLYEVNDDGYVVAKGTRGTVNERAIQYVDKNGSNQVKIDATTKSALAGVGIDWGPY